MFDRFTAAALAAALVLASAGVTVAQARMSPSRAPEFAPAYDEGNYYTQRYRRGNEQFCYLPSEPCDNDHRVDN